MHKYFTEMEETQGNRVNIIYGLSLFFMVTHREGVLVAGNLGTRAGWVDGTPRTASQHRSAFLVTPPENKYINKVVVYESLPARMMGEGRILHRGWNKGSQEYINIIVSEYFIQRNLTVSTITQRLPT